MQWMLASLIHFVMALLESAFKKKKPGVDDTPKNGTNHDDDMFKDDQDHYDNDHYDHYDNHDHDDKTRQNKKVQQAYEFLELQPPCTVPQLHKQYKRLSLKYHPDRRQGSHELMTKLNACRAIVEQDIQPGDDTNHDDDDQSHDDDHSHDDDNDSWDSQRARAEMEQMWHEEQERLRQEHEQFQQAKQRHKQECHNRQRELGLQSQAGREQAQQEFLQRVQAQQQQQQREKQEKPDESQNNNGSTSSSDNNTPQEEQNNPKSKPQNPVMEYNADDFATALRLGKGDIALDILEERLNYHLQSRQMEAQLTGNRHKITFHQVGLEFLIKPVDLDGNTILHYAIYYQAYNIVNAICGMAQKFHGLAAVLQAENQYGKAPGFLAQLLPPDDAIARLLAAQWQVVRAHESQTQVWPALTQAGRQLGQIVRNVDALGTGCILGFWYLGGSCALHPVTRVAALVFVQYRGNMTERATEPEYRAGIRDVTLFVSFCGTWIGLQALMAWILRIVMVEFLIMVSPFVVAALVSHSYYQRRRGMLGFVLLPLEWQAQLAGYMEKVLVLWCQGLAGLTNTKELILSGKGGRWVKPILLTLIIMGAKGIQHISS